MILDIERVAHGGVCVAHADDGRVVFVRHALPGEQVRARVTEERRSYLRADAIEVLRPAAARVTPPCPWAGPGRCGGCDWQHVALDEQRRLKAAVVEEQLARLAGITRDVAVVPVPDQPAARDGLHWRTRLRLATDEGGRAGFRRHRSHEIEPIEDCLIAVTGAQVGELVGRTWPADVEVTVDVSAAGERAVAVGSHPDTVTEHAAGRDWAVPVGGFWQVHVGAAELLAATVAELAAPSRSDRCVDLYSGVGLFAGALAPLVAHTTAVESDRRACAAARRNLEDLDVRVVHDRVDRWVRSPHDADLVVLDPPRKGAGRDVVSRLAGFGARRLVYVACDPSALARDAAVLAHHGYELGELRAFDLFPMTAHVECVAAFDRTDTAAQSTRS